MTDSIHPVTASPVRPVPRRREVSARSRGDLRMVRGFVWAGTAFLLMLAFSSCAQHYQLTAPSDMTQLPVRRGWAGFNVVATTPWRYMGSRYQTHEFRYYFDRDDALKYRDVSVARDRTVLRFEEKSFGSIRKWVVLQTDGQTFYFSLLELH